jgi:hypothetical protein
MTVELEFVRIEVNESFDRRLYCQLRVPIYQSRALVRNQLLGGKKSGVGTCKDYFAQFHGSFCRLVARP